MMKMYLMLKQSLLITLDGHHARGRVVNLCIHQSPGIIVRKTIGCNDVFTKKNCKKFEIYFVPVVEAFFFEMPFEQ